LSANKLEEEKNIKLTTINNNTSQLI